MQILNLGHVVGMSAYELAVLKGYKGTLEQWLDSLRYDHSEEYQEFKRDIENALSKFLQNKNALESDISAIRSLVTASMTNIENAKKQAITDIESRSNTALNDISSKGSAAASEINRSRADALSMIAKSLENTISSVQEAGETWEQRLDDLGRLKRQEFENAAEAKSAEEIAKIDASDMPVKLEQLFGAFGLFKDETKRKIEKVVIDVADHDGRIYRIEQEIGQMDMESLDFEQMIKNISTGNGKNFYPVGDQILMNYNYNGADYECPHNIVDHGSDVILDGEGNEAEVPSMTIEWEYTIPNGLAFDPPEAMYVAPESGLPAGTYHFKVDGDSWNSENGKTFQFALAEPLAEGMHLRPTKNYNAAFANTNMCVYADGKSTTALQTVKITEGNGGADLGIMGSGDLNHYHRIFLGYNRWSQSLYRQWLNSEGTGWWTPQNKFDRAPSNVDSLAGFLSNIPEEFRNVLKPVKLQTYRNSVTDDGGIDVTYDKVFLLAFANWNNESNSSIQSSGNGVEGDAYEYYRRIADGVANLNSKGNFRIWQTYPILIRYALNAKTSAQYVFSRSASRTSGNTVLNVSTSGSVSSTNASYGNRCRPAFKICGNLPSHASAE